MAVPMTVKMPDPMTAPMPRAVSDHGPRDFFSAFSGSSDSRISLSMDLQETSWERRLPLLSSDAGPGTAARAIRRTFRVRVVRIGKVGKITPPDRGGVPVRRFFQ